MTGVRILARMDLALKAALVFACLWAAMWPACVVALDPRLDVSQYGHTAWRNGDGFGPGTIQPIAQTLDGFLWLGGPLGLMRFDGVTSVNWQPPAGSALPDQRVRALLGTRDGTLWIGTLRGLASWKEGKLVTHAPFVGKFVNAFAEDGDGTLWVGGGDARTAFLCAIRKTGTECQGGDGRFGSVILSLYVDGAGTLWVGGTDRVWRWTPAPARAYTLPNPMAALGVLTGAANGGVLVSTLNGVVRINEDGVQPGPAAVGPGGKYFNKILSDRNGAVWMALLEGGLMHLHEGRIDTYQAADGLSGDQIYGLFEDREGNMWVSTRDGLDRFRPVAASLYGRTQGMSGRALAVLAAKDGSLWSSSTVALNRLQAGRVTEVRSLGGSLLYEDRRGRIWIGTRSVLGRAPELGYVEGDRFVSVHVSPSLSDNNDAIAEDSQGGIWVAQRGGLLRVRTDGKLDRIPWTELGDAGPASSLATDPVDGGLWLGFWSGGVMHWRDGKIRKVAGLESQGPPGHSVNHIRAEKDGALWVATEMGLSRVRNGVVTRLDRASGLPCDSVYWSLEDAQSTWIYTGCGVVQVARAEVAAWIAAATRGVKHVVAVRLLDHWDGVRTDLFINGVGQTPQLRPYSPRMALTPDGLVWVVTLDGIAFIDPARLPFNALPPAVHVERVVGDGTSYEMGASVRLPPLVRNLEIHYNGLSLTLPQKVRFRYKLEGRDAVWQDAGNRRTAFYTDLPPGSYRFHVMAANNSGVWNKAGASLGFTIAPAWWQTSWFRWFGAAALALVLHGVYRLRMASLTRRYGMALDARVNERLRIARELHDTLLQSFQGLLLRMQVALRLWPRAEGREMLEKTIDQAAGAIAEGRDAVQGLRDSANDTNDLALSIRTLGETLVTEGAAHETPTLAVEAHSRPRALDPVLRDEIFRIASEAMRNAFRHAQARNVRVEIHYDANQFRLEVCDDGKGLSPRILAGDVRTGSYGLRGMRERAMLIGGQVAIWSAEQAGTQVELVVPASRAYAGAPSPIRALFSERNYSGS